MGPAGQFYEKISRLWLGWLNDCENIYQSWFNQVQKKLHKVHLPLSFPSSHSGTHNMQSCIQADSSSFDAHYEFFPKKANCINLPGGYFFLNERLSYVIILKKYTSIFRKSISLIYKTRAFFPQVNASVFPL